MILSIKPTAMHVKLFLCKSHNCFVKYFNYSEGNSHTIGLVYVISRLHDEYIGHSKSIVADNIIAHCKN